jgi:alkanesulfonate monooxygenase SsuD/methylene tetrahydromethanopterin reductase-like flavin-dependent oxidoreductase (luciferase family)
VRVDLLLLQDAPAAELVERAKCAEEMGFGAVWVADHFVNPHAPSTDWLDGWTLLGAFALATSRVRLGPLVSAPALRCPSLLALQATTVDHLSGGRLEIGVGAGGAPLDIAMMGLADREPAERFGRLAEMVEIVDDLLAHGEVVHHGRFYDVEARVQRPVQTPRPPLVVGALAPRALRLAAAHADAVSTYAVVKNLSSGVATGDEAVDLIRERMAIVDAECKRIGRDPSSLRRSLLTFFGILEPLPSADEFADWTRPYREIGIGEFVVYWPVDDDPEKLRELTATP